MKSSEPAVAPIKQPIPVKVLYFPRPTDCPGKSVASSIVAGGPNNGSRWTIDYRPWLRMYRIEYTAPGETKVLHRMIPESWASAEFYE